MTRRRAARAAAVPSSTSAASSIWMTASVWSRAPRRTHHPQLAPAVALGPVGDGHDVERPLPGRPQLLLDRGDDEGPVVPGHLDHRAPRLVPGQQVDPGRSHPHEPAVVAGRCRQLHHGVDGGVGRRRPLAPPGHGRHQAVAHGGVTDEGTETSRRAGRGIVPWRDARAAGGRDHPGRARSAAPGPDGGRVRRPPSPKFSSAPAAVGAEIGGVRRRGKYLLIDLSGSEDETTRSSVAWRQPHPSVDAVPEGRELIVHLGMTGQLGLDLDRRRARTPGPGGPSTTARTLDLPRRPPLRPHRGRAGRRPPQPPDPPRHRARALRRRLHARGRCGGPCTPAPPGSRPSSSANAPSPGSATSTPTRRCGGPRSTRPPAGSAARGRPACTRASGRPRRRPGQRRDDPARLPHRHRRARAQPARPRLLRPLGPALPALRGDPAAVGARRPHQHLVPPLPDAMKAPAGAGASMAIRLL